MTRLITLHSPSTSETSTKGDPWQTQGLCTQTDPEAFFHDADRLADRIEQHAVVAKICAECPVFDLCKQAGETEHHGVWAGECRECTSRPRQTRKSQSVARDTCGSAEGYDAHVEYGDKICPQCVGAGIRRRNLERERVAVEAKTELVEIAEKRAHLREMNRISAAVRTNTAAAVKMLASPHGTAEGRKNLGILIESIKEKK